MGIFSPFSNDGYQYDINVHLSLISKIMVDGHYRAGKRKMSFKLEEMTTKDKLKAMEVLWDDICRNLPDFLSPAWHENILKEREHKL